jgi:NADPH-dependent ferric siderophore reductase
LSSRVRREPPRFRHVEVRGVAARGPRLVRITLGGPELDGFAVGQPASSVRLLLPPAGSADLVVPAWNGNEFLLPDGTRPVIRTLTPLRASGDSLDVEIVLHGGGAASQWAASAAPGLPVALSGPGRGYTVDADASSFLLAGDETAIPAITELLGLVPPSATVAVHIEVAAPDGRVDMPGPVEWHDVPPGGAPGDGFVPALRAASVDEGTRVWVAGEAAAVQRVRRFLFEERGLPRSQATVRGYWKIGRAASGDD